MDTQNQHLLPRARVRTRRRVLTSVLTAAALATLGLASVPSALGHPQVAGDPPLHGGTGQGVRVVGHSTLGTQGLHGHVAVLGDYAYVGNGANGGTGFNWNKTPRCNDAPVPADHTVKVVSLVTPSNPTVVTEIPVTAPDPTLDKSLTLARDVAALRVTGPVPYDLLAIALESCSRTGGGAVGLTLYDVTNPAVPQFLGRDFREVGNTATRDVNLVQRADGRVFAVLADQGGTLGGIHVTDVTNPRAPVQIGTFDEENGAASTRECRPFSFAQGVSTNAAGTKAYAAYQDAGLFVLDLNTLASGTAPLPQLNKLGQATYPASEEGNSFQFVPNSAETLAVATDEDLNPASTTITVASGPAAGTYRACEALWGSGAPLTGPLFRRTTPSLANRDIVAIDNNGCNATDYPAGFTGKIALTVRGGACSFDGRARTAEAAGAAAVLISNTAVDHHLTGGTGVLFSPDSVDSVDAGVTIPVAMVTREFRAAVVAAGGTVNGTMADTADSWGALRIFNLPVPTGNPTQAAVFHTPNSNTLTPGNGDYHAVNTTWDTNDHVMVSWMSNGLRVVDVRTPSAPVQRAHYTPPAASDPTGNYPTVPLVVGVAKAGTNVVITDVNGGLYVLDLLRDKEQCKMGGHSNYGFANQGTCIDFLGQ